jgi:hypothetical protein
MKGKYSPSFKQRNIRSTVLGTMNRRIFKHMQVGLGLVSVTKIHLLPYGRQEFPTTTRILLDLDQSPERHTVGGSQAYKL